MGRKKKLHYTYVSDTVRIYKGNVQVSENELHKLPSKQIEAYEAQEIIRKIKDDE